MHTALLRIGIACLILASSLPVGASAVAASDRCVPAVAAAEPIGTTPCFGPRPGAFIEVPVAGSACTLGFLFRDARTRRSYMTTAGHCVLPVTGQRTWKRETGPQVRELGGRKIGTIAFAAMHNEMDFALVLIDRRVAAKPQVCHFGGPTGLNDERRTEPDVLSFYGNADGLRELIPARSGVTLNTRNATFVYAQAPIALGDSGGPWLTSDGRALGYLTHILGFGTGTELGTALVRRLGPQVSNAERALNLDLKLVTAPVIP